jgi:hypothetical protein
MNIYSSLLLHPFIFILHRFSIILVLFHHFIFFLRYFIYSTSLSLLRFLPFLHVLLLSSVPIL